MTEPASVKLSNYRFNDQYDFTQDRKVIDTDMTNLFLGLQRYQKYVLFGNGSPEGVVNGFVGSMYLNFTGGTSSAWSKQTGDGTTTGWALLGSGAVTPGSLSAIGIPALPITSVQYNDNGIFGGDATQTFNKTTKVLLSNSFASGTTSASVVSDFPFAVNGQGGNSYMNWNSSTSYWEFYVSGVKRMEM